MAGSLYNNVRAALTRLHCRQTYIFFNTRLSSSHSGDNNEEKAEHQYKAYQDWDYGDKPYMMRKLVRYGNFDPRYYQHGPLPRPKINATYNAKPIPQKVFDPEEMNAWTKDKALAGQNDYIDILGDGTIHPWELIDAPLWLKGFKGKSEFQRLFALMKYQGRSMRLTRPLEYSRRRKAMLYLAKKMNTTRRIRGDDGIPTEYKRKSGGRFTNLDWGQ